jgi:MoxR-like ATPase
MANPPTATTATATPTASAAPAGRARTPAEHARERIGQVVYGNLDAVDCLLVALAAGGHCLLDGIPGVGKTTLARTFAQITGLQFQRIQLTPDLLPADITGYTFYDQGKKKFETRMGPIMSQVVLADELNRTPPRTQAALLEAMQEGQVTIDGVTHRLPKPFLLVATKNPIELEGVYPLPGAELDRFLVSVRVHYPERAVEAAMLKGTAAATPTPPPMPNLAAALKEAFAQTKVNPDIIEYVMDLVEATRKHDDIVLGASPRAARQLIEAARGRAAVLGRTFVTPDDVKHMARYVLRHRLVLRPEAELAGRTPEDLVHDLLQQITVPIGRKQ